MSQLFFFEYMMDCAVPASEKGLKNVMVSNGFINPGPLAETLPYLDAFNIDLKSFRQEFYQKRSSARLKPVLETIATLAASDRHLELTFLLIPGQNDDPVEWKDMIGWIEKECGADTILHVSRFFPRYKLRTMATPSSVMEAFLDLAREKLHYVYPGNNPDLNNDTYCPRCNKHLIRRSFYRSELLVPLDGGHCPGCGAKDSRCIQ